jgi:integrase
VPYARSKTLSTGLIRWYAAYLGADGRMHEEGGYTTRREAERVAHRREAAAASGDWASAADSKMSFTAYVDRFYWPSAAHLEAATRATYDLCIKKHLKPRFGHLPMRKVTAPLVQAWVNELAVGHKPSTVAKYHAVLHTIFVRARIDRVVAYNPCDDTELPKIIRSPKKIVTPEQFDVILSKVPDEYRLFVLVAVETGCRWGELAALRRCDVDMTTHLVTVRRAAVEVAKRHSPTGEQRFIKDYPKSGKQRIVQIEPATTQSLREHVLAQGIREDELLFGTTRGTIISRNTFRTRIWVPAVEGAGLPLHVRFHDLRAAHISWLLAGGADVPLVMERVGHSSMATTQQYVGTLPDSGERALAAFRKVRER